MHPDSRTYRIWVGGSCDYGHKERAGAAAAFPVKEVHVAMGTTLAHLVASVPWVPDNHDAIKSYDNKPLSQWRSISRQLD